MAKLSQLGTIGRLGEEVAVRYLKSQNYKVIGQNITYKWGEVDVLVEKDNQLHFVEVKTASAQSNLQVRLGERVDARKLRRIQKAAQTYLASENLVDVPWQIDVLLVLIDQSKKEARVSFLQQVTS